MSLTPRVTPLETGLFDWLNLFVRSSFLKELSESEAKKLMEEIVEECRVDCQDEGGKWSMMYMRLRFSAVMN